MKKLIVSLLLLGSASLATVAQAQTYETYRYTPAGERITVYEAQDVGMSPNTRRIHEGVVGNASLFERGLIHVYYTNEYDDNNWRWDHRRWQRWCDNNPDARGCWEDRRAWNWDEYR